ncbi:MAG: hypothetical protein ACXVA9_02820, partial [Bdellovibrionales bacterium]
MSESLPESKFAEKQEVSRVDILFRQNGTAIFIQFLYAVPYCYASWEVSSHLFLIAWTTFYFSLGVVRAVMTKRWKKQLGPHTTSADARRWLSYLQVMLFLSGACWLPIAWNFPQATGLQQLLTALPLIFMCAGSVCLYAGSLSSTYLIVLPPFLTWVAAMLLSDHQELHIVGAMAFGYFVVGMMVAKALNRYMMNSLRLTIEYSNAKEALRESNESLSMALQSSSAMTWSWDVVKKAIRCEGDFRALGIDSGFVEGTEGEYLALVDSTVRVG